jgi:protein O-GlcNAc transferase
MNTALEAIEEGLPIITLPGRLMRERHTYAVLTMMDVKETIVSTVGEYVDKAVLLAKDPSCRRGISIKVAESRHRVYRDISAIRALEEFLRKCVLAPESVI